MESVYEDLAKIHIKENDKGLVKRKDELRKVVWDYMEENDLIEEYPRPCHNKIPHFKVGPLSV